MAFKKEMRELVDKLNEASYAYYNTGNPIMEEQMFDFLFKKLEDMERATGLTYSDSPTINVGSRVLPGLVEVNHSHDMLSLAKCHSADEIVKFGNNHTLVAMTKCDGLTITLKYENGELVSAQTRGDGKRGIDCTEHAKMFTNIPIRIPYHGTFEVDGEAVIKNDDFEEVNKNNMFKNPRNLAAGTLNSLDTRFTKERKLSFIAWDLITDNHKEGSYYSFNDVLSLLELYGFEVVSHVVLDKSEINIRKINETNGTIVYMSENIPYDGVVWKFDDIEYGRSLGKTSHHFNNGIAYKFKDEEATTILRDITWNAENKTGIITPVAEFDPVELEGTEVSRATLHNISIMKELNIEIGKEITVIKANQIIPKIIYCNSDNYNFEIPEICPICGSKTKIVKQNASEILMCTNLNCKGKWLGKLIQLVSKDAMDIDGLSEQTLRLLVNQGLLNSYSAIFELDNHKKKLQSLPGFGLRSVTKLLTSIEKARQTTLSRFLISLSIPNVGKHVSQIIENMVVNSTDDDPLEYFVNHYKDMKLENVDGIGDVIISSLYSFMDENKQWMIDFGKKYLIFNNEKENKHSNKLNGLTFVITGNVNMFKNRKELSDAIISNGGKVSGSVSKNTDYLINNDPNSSSSKNKKANDLGVRIITEKELIETLLT